MHKKEEIIILQQYNILKINRTLFNEDSIKL